eukprot:m.1379671 g.1379671  ORF g.1379671 m.1379671 type:complete len:82 (-) comp24967_c0_seq3:3276-3521(-)
MRPTVVLRSWLALPPTCAGVNGLTEDTTKATRPKWLEAATRSIGKHWEKTNAEYHAWWRQNLLNHDVSESELRTHLAPLAG